MRFVQGTIMSHVCNDDRDDRGLCNLVPTMSLNRIVLLHPSININIIVNVDYKYRASGPSHPFRTHFFV